MRILALQIHTIKCHNPIHQNEQKQKNVACRYHRARYRLSTKCATFPGANSRPQFIILLKSPRSQFCFRNMSSSLEAACYFLKCLGQWALVFRMPNENLYYRLSAIRLGLEGHNSPLAFRKIFSSCLLSALFDVRKSQISQIFYILYHWLDIMASLKAIDLDVPWPCGPFSFDIIDHISFAWWVVTSRSTLTP